MRRIVALAVFLATFVTSSISFAQNLERGAQAFFEKDYDVAYEELMPLAEEGEPMAEFLIGSMYSEGLGLPQDRKTGFVWMRRAADHGNVYAQALLGAMYRYGRGIPKDYDKAFTYFSLAVDQGSEAALHGLAGLYHYGLGVQQNTEKAISLYKRSAEAGMEDAYNDLGKIYEEDVFVNKDLERAKGWYRLAAVAGDSEGQENYIRLKKITSNEITNREDIASSSNLDDRFSKALDFIKGGDLKTGIKYLIPLVKEGHADSQFTLGMMHTLGEGLPVNRPEGLRLFRLAAEQGHAEGQHMAGLYTSVEGTALYNRKEAIKWLRLAADQGVEGAGELLAEMGQELETEHAAQAEYTKQKVIETRKPRIEQEMIVIDGFKEGIEAYTSQDYFTALELLYPLAEEGVVEAQFMMGEMFRQGLGVSQSKAEAAKWMKRAADQGHAKARFHLNNLNGDASQLGGKTARKQTAAIPKPKPKPDEIPKRNDTSREILVNKASKTNQSTKRPDLTPSAGYLKGMEAYDNNNDRTAFRIWSDLAKKGDPNAQYALGHLYIEGKVVEQYYPAVIKYFTLAADQGHIEAQYNLGVLYDTAQGVEKDLTKAVKWYRLAAENGYADAQFSLGDMYEFGDGVPQNSSLAAKWYKLAAAQGDENPKRYRDDMEKEMSPGQVTAAKILVQECLAQNYQGC